MNRKELRLILSNRRGLPPFDFSCVFIYHVLLLRTQKKDDPSMILACHHISKEYPENIVLRDITFHLEKGDKAALIGINGAGKTTLLKIIMGEESADEGTVSFERDCSIGYLAQNQDLSSDRTVYEEVLSVKQ